MYLYGELFKYLCYDVIVAQTFSLFNKERLSVLYHLKRKETVFSMKESCTANSDNKKIKKFKYHENLSVSCQSRYDKINTETNERRKRE